MIEPALGNSAEFPAKCGQRLLYPFGTQKRAWRKIAEPTKENIFAPTSTEDPQHEENLLGDISTLLDMVVPMRIVVMTPNPLLVDMKGTLIGSTPDPNVMYSYENNATEDNYCGLHSSAECGLMVFGTLS